MESVSVYGTQAAIKKFSVGVANVSVVCFDGLYAAGLGSHACAIQPHVVLLMIGSNNVFGVADLMAFEIVHMAKHKSNVS